MDLQTWAWLAMAAYSAHILEEYTFDWRNWARNVIHLPVEWSDFYVTNAVVVALGIAQAELAPTLPLAPLAYASLMLINALLFHIMPVIRAGGRFSPGLITAIVLFLPVVYGVSRSAMEAGVFTLGNVLGGLVAGALLMAYPIVMLKLRSRSYFNQVDR